MKMFSKEGVEMVEVKSIQRKDDTLVMKGKVMGSMATQDEPFVRALYRALKKEGVGFLHLSPAPRSVCRAMAASEGVAYDVPDFSLDAETAAAWDAVLERATNHGDALVMMRATPAALAFLDAQLTKKDGPGFRLVAPSTVLHRAPSN